MTERTYDSRWSIDDDLFDNSLEITFRDPGLDGPSQVFRIPIEQVADFVQQVTQHGMQALTSAAIRLEAGDCPECQNVGLVDGPAPGGRTQQIYCPACRERRNVTAFRNTPTISITRKEP